MGLSDVFSMFLVLVCRLNLHPLVVVDNNVRSYAAIDMSHDSR